MPQSKRKRPDPKNKRFAPPSNVKTMDDILRAAARTPAENPQAVTPPPLQADQVVRRKIGE